MDTTTPESARFKRNARFFKAKHFAAIKLAFRTPFAMMEV